MNHVKRILGIFIVFVFWPATYGARQHVTVEIVYGGLQQSRKVEIPWKQGITALAARQSVAKIETQKQEEHFLVISIYRELARLFNDKFLARTARLTVIPMEGWTRSMWFDETGLLWIIPSPNMPTLDTATVYPGLVAFEGTNLSEGRGTTRPFEQFGAPWIDGNALAARLNALGLPGVRFREAWFTPFFSKFQAELCGGCQVHVTDRKAFRSVAAVLHIIAAVRSMYPDKFAFHAEYFDKVMGTASVRKALEAGTDVATILASMQPGLDAFAALRKPYLLF